jgi:hypothetical protein
MKGTERDTQVDNIAHGQHQATWAYTRTGREQQMSKWNERLASSEEKGGKDCSEVDRAYVMMSSGTAEQNCKEYVLQKL